MHTSRSEMAKCKRNSWTGERWPRRRDEVMIDTTVPLPNKPTSDTAPTSKQRVGISH